jgi:hypothetical protein
MKARGFVVVAMMLAAPAFAQAPGGGPTANTKGASVPDFSGIWAHPSGRASIRRPGPVVNRSRNRNGFGNSNQLVSEYTNPILKPVAAEVIRKYGEIPMVQKM